jgi:hypothetical protein
LRRRACSKRPSGWERCWPLFDRQVERLPNGRGWILAAAIHIAAVILFFTVPLQAPWRQTTYVIMEPADTAELVVFTPGTREARAAGPTVTPTRSDSTPPPPSRARPTAAVTGAAAAAAAAPAPAPSDSAGMERAASTAATPNTTAAAVAAAAAAVRQRDTTAMPAYDPNASRVAPAPRVGDGRLWVSPRPGLPASVAEVLYGDTTGRRDAAITRLRAMVDSLNEILDQMQRDRQRPSWTVGGTPDKPTWGLDSAYIHIAGIKIPSTVLAALGWINGLAQGNFDEDMRNRQLNYMREDILRAADRAQSLQEFKRYVRELRERRQAERDAEDRRRAQDTVRAVP